VRFLGFRDDVPDLLAAADFFLLPSRMEGMPLSVLEAMSHALPVIATPVGGVPEVITEGEHGYFVPVDDPMVLSAAIARLVAEPALGRRFGAAAQERVGRQFTFDAMLDRYAVLYRGQAG
jgi:glycosyltransferase involved in cell wall biosynthesis